LLLAFAAGACGAPTTIGNGPFTAEIGNAICTPTECGCGTGKTCNGSCGPGCVLRCLGAACTVTVGEGGYLLCKGDGARCDATLGAGAIVECGFGAVCNLRCIGACKVLCEGTFKTCNLGCGTAMPVTLREGGSCS
jgi:hypothetical protein